MKQLYLLLVSLFISCISYAQELEYGDWNKEEWSCQDEDINPNAWWRCPIEWGIQDDYENPIIPVMPDITSHQPTNDAIMESYIESTTPSSSSDTVSYLDSSHAPTETCNDNEPIADNAMLSETMYPREAQPDLIAPMPVRSKPDSTKSLEKLHEQALVIVKKGMKQRIEKKSVDHKSTCELCARYTDNRDTTALYSHRNFNQTHRKLFESTPGEQFPATCKKCRVGFINSYYDDRHAKSLEHKMGNYNESLAIKFTCKSFAKK